MRRGRAAILLLLLLAGCGLGAGEERGGAGAELRVTTGFGSESRGSVRVAKLREGQTVMRLLQSEFDVETRFGGRFVQAIDGLEGEAEAARGDWFFWVNGIESDRGAAEYELSPGDRVQWDLRRWDAALRVPAIVGAFPEPFENGWGGERRPVRLECEDPRSSSCREAKERLGDAGVAVSGATLGAPGTDQVIRVVVGRWAAVRRVAAAQLLEQDPGASGVFARFGEDGRSLELLDAAGRPAERVGPGDGTGLVAALRPHDDELVWVVTGLDDRAVESAAAALEEERLRDRFAVAATGSATEGLPVEER